MRVPVLALLLSALILATSPALAQVRVGPQPGPVARFDPQRVDALMATAQSRSSQIAALRVSLLGELEALRDNKPRPPGPGAPAAELAAHQAALASWQTEMQRLSRRIESLLEGLLDAERELTKLQHSDLPAAQQKDAANIRRQLEAQREGLEAAASALEEEAANASADAAPQARRKITTAEPTRPPKGPLSNRATSPKSE